LLKQQGRRSGIAGIADGQTYNLERASPAHAEIEEVLIFGHQNQAAQTDQAPMGGAQEPLDQQRQ
jgi:riboflavin synthase alpha subunit